MAVAIVSKEAATVALMEDPAQGVGKSIDGINLA
jgi:hypothetical protein